MKKYIFPIIIIVSFLLTNNALAFDESSVRITKAETSAYTKDSFRWDFVVNYNGLSDSRSNNFLTSNLPTSRDIKVRITNTNTGASWVVGPDTCRVDDDTSNTVPSDPNDPRLCSGFGSGSLNTQVLFGGVVNKTLLGDGVYSVRIEQINFNKKASPSGTFTWLPNAGTVNNLANPVIELPRRVPSNLNIPFGVQEILAGGVYQAHFEFWIPKQYDPLAIYDPLTNFPIEVKDELGTSVSFSSQPNIQSSYDSTDEEHGGHIWQHVNIYYPFVPSRSGNYTAKLNSITLKFDSNECSDCDPVTIPFSDKQVSRDIEVGGPVIVKNPKITSVTVVGPQNPPVAKPKMGLSDTGTISWTGSDLSDYTGTYDFFVTQVKFTKKGDKALSGRSILAVTPFSGGGQKRNFTLPAGSKVGDYKFEVCLTGVANSCKSGYLKVVKKSVAGTTRPSSGPAQDLLGVSDMPSPLNKDEQVAITVTDLRGVEAPYQYNIFVVKAADESASTWAISILTAGGNRSGVWLAGKKANLNEYLESGVNYKLKVCTPMVNGTRTCSFGNTFLYYDDSRSSLLKFKDFGRNLGSAIKAFGDLLTR